MIIYEEPSPEAYDAEENAFPAAGPVRVVYQDGSCGVFAAHEGGDEPDKGQVRGVEAPDTQVTCGVAL